MNFKNFKFRTLWPVLGLVLWALWMDSLSAQPLTDLIGGNNGAAASTPPDKTISADYSQQNDAKMEKRLQRIFSELDDLKNIKVTVNNGVVTLQGEVTSVKAEDKALQFAGQLENVVEVQNKIVVNQKLSLRLRHSLEKMLSISIELIASLPLFTVAVVIVIAFWLLGKWLSGKQELYRRFTDNYFIANILSVITYLALIVLGVIMALTLLDATALIGTFMGAAGIFGLALGFAVKDTVENFITSLLLSIRNPFEVKDFVNIDGHEGTVARLTSRATILISPDNNHIRIPNAVVFKSVIVNYSRQPERRFQFDVVVDTGQNLLTVQSLALKSVLEVSGILPDPKPMVVIQEWSNVNVSLRVYAWVNQQTHSLLKVRSEAIRLLKETLDKAGIAAPKPVYNLKLLDQDMPPPKAVDKPPAVEKSASSDIHAHTEHVKDVRADDTVETQINKENAAGDSENLLTKGAPKEG